MNILVIRTHRFGDILQLTTMLRGLKEKYTQGKIYCLIGKDFAQLLETNCDVDAIIPIPEKEYRYLLKNKPQRYSWIFNELYDLISELRQKEFDLIINRQYEWGSILSHLIGAKQIYGGSYSPEKGFYFEDQPSKELFHLIKNNRKTNKRNLVDWACRVGGVAPAQNRCMFFLPHESSRREALTLLGDKATGHDKSLVAIQMGAAKSFRQWGVEKFAEIIRWLVKEREKQVVLIGSEDEKDLAGPIESTIAEQGLLINLIGKTSLHALGAVLEKCECLISGDTGPMHLAAAVGTPVLSLFFGTAYPWETGPYGRGHFVLYSDVPCAPCFDPNRCQDGHRCKKEITPDLTMKAFEVAEAFWKNEPVHWDLGSHSARLFVTAQGEEGEQILLPPEDVCDLTMRPIQRATEKRDMECSRPEILLERGDEVIRSFFAGEAERGFSDFVKYLESWLVAKDAVINDHPEMKKEFSALVEQCLLAMQNQDLVTLMDSIEYGFKALIQRSTVSGLGRNIGSNHA